MTSTKALTKPGRWIVSKGDSIHPKEPNIEDDIHISDETFKVWSSTETFTGEGWGGVD